MAYRSEYAVSTPSGISMSRYLKLIDDEHGT